MINQWETTLPITSDRSLSVVDVLAGVSTGSPHTVADELAAAFSDHVAACVG